MRRLANQTRNDVYNSARDYQKIHSKRSICIVPSGDGPHTIVMRKTCITDANTLIVASGGYIFPSDDVNITISIEAQNQLTTKIFALKNRWQRVGIAAAVTEAGILSVKISWSGNVSLNLWGFNADRVNLPAVLVALEADTVDHLSASHIAPETFYLDHDNAMYLDIDEEMSTVFRSVPGADINVKKCSYCGRMLPLSMEYKGFLAFHQHSAKLSNHQNECRSCKKWRINVHFNPIRTHDQLHESSVITREKKLLLREPEILQEIKEREGGAGLKSQVWERFERKCFYCDKDLELDDVQLDHTRPLSYLFPIDVHATCLCAEHNNQKKDKFPVDFYNEDQLRRLSGITGLDYDVLCQKDVNGTELDRILADLTGFAREWDPRTFQSIARRVFEMREIDLFDLLLQQAPETHSEIMLELAERPAAVGDEE